MKTAVAAEIRLEEGRKLEVDEEYVNKDRA